MLQKACISSTDASASMNRTSAPASANAWTLHRASSSPTACLQNAKQQVATLGTPMASWGDAAGEISGTVPGIRAGDDHDILALIPGIHGSSDPCDCLLAGAHPGERGRALSWVGRPWVWATTSRGSPLVAHVSAGLGRYLVLDQNPGKPGSSVTGNGPLDVHRVAVARVAVPDDRNVASGLHDVPACISVGAADSAARRALQFGQGRRTLVHHLVVADEAGVRGAEPRSGGAETRHEGEVKVGLRWTACTSARSQPG